MLRVRIPGRRSGLFLLAGLMVLPALSAVAWWQASPGYAVARLQQAALSGDAAAVAERVDFPALRESLKAQLRHRLLAEARPATSSLAGIGTSMALAFIDPMVDAAVTPETIGAVVSMAGEWHGPAALAAVGALAATGPELRIGRAGLDRFSLRVADAPAVPTLIFCRERLRWTLCAVDLSQPA